MTTNRGDLYKLRVHHTWNLSAHPSERVQMKQIVVVQTETSTHPMLQGSLSVLNMRGDSSNVQEGKALLFTSADVIMNALR